MGLSEAELRNRWDALRLNTADVERLASIAPVLSRNAEQLTSIFFDYLAGFPEADRLFSDPVTLRRARKLKQSHLPAMTKGSFALDYVEQRVDLALVYGGANLGHHVFMSAFHHLIAEAGRLIMSSGVASETGCFDAFLSLNKVASFDISVIGDVLTFERQRVIRQQQQIIRTLSTPVLKARDRLLLVPLIGVLDTFRADQLMDDLLGAISEHRAKVVVIDITGTASVDSAAANSLVKTVDTARLMGAEIIVTGVSTMMAHALVKLGIDLARLDTVGDLQGGIARAEQLLTALDRARPSGAGANGDATRVREPPG